MLLASSGLLLLALLAPIFCKAVPRIEFENRPSNKKLLRFNLLLFYIRPPYMLD
jgi:hypothetical protein